VRIRCTLQYEDPQHAMISSAPGCFSRVRLAASLQMASTITSRSRYSVPQMAAAPCPHMRLWCGVAILMGHGSLAAQLQEVVPGFRAMAHIIRRPLVQEPHAHKGVGGALSLAARRVNLP
jgi:hypothetical protein